MRITLSILLASLMGFCFLSATGCSSDKAEVAPRTQSEIEAYKQDAYGAEEEMDAEGDDDE